MSGTWRWRRQLARSHHGCWRLRAQQCGTWVSGGVGCRPSRCGLSALTVRAATELQLLAVEQQRRARFERFAACAVRDTPVPAPQPAAGKPWSWEIQRLFKRVWALPCPNKSKEVWWRLVYCASQMHLPCTCAAPERGREHVFWCCAAAQAVVAEVLRCLARASSGVGLAISRYHFWLGVPPPGQFSEGWLVVVSAALDAMERARCYMVATRDDDDPPSIQQVSHRAVACFWARLAEFCELGAAPDNWRGQPSAFFRWVPGPEADSGHWEVTR